MGTDSFRLEKTPLQKGMETISTELPVLKVYRLPFNNHANYMVRNARKVICKQRRSRSACAFVQYDLSFIC